MIDSFKGEYGWLSNFAHVKVKLDGLVYPSVENAYQAAKTHDLSERMMFMTCTSLQAKKLGRSIKLRWDWEDQKSIIMRDLVEQKFLQEPYRTLLLATGEETIVEGNWWGDTYWGVCNGKGENMLGKILMAVREHLK